MTIFRSLLVAPLFFATLSFNAHAGVDDATRKQVIAELGAKVSDVYVFPDKARQVVERLEAQEKSGAYRSAKDLKGFAEMLTTDLRQPTRDKHLGVRHSVKPIPEDQNRPEPTPEMERRFANYLKSQNYGIRKVETLPGNIGYIDLRQFAMARLAKPALTAMMTLVADTDALIVDLR